MRILWYVELKSPMMILLMSISLYICQSVSLNVYMYLEMSVCVCVRAFVRECVYMCRVNQNTYKSPQSGKGFVSSSRIPNEIKAAQPLRAVLWLVDSISSQPSIINDSRVRHNVKEMECTWLRELHFSGDSYHMIKCYHWSVTQVTNVKSSLKASPLMIIMVTVIFLVVIVIRSSISSKVYN